MLRGREPISAALRMEVPEAPILRSLHPGCLGLRERVIDGLLAVQVQLELVVEVTHQLLRHRQAGELVGGVPLL